MVTTLERDERDAKRRVWLARQKLTLQTLVPGEIDEIADIFWQTDKGKQMGVYPPA